jgi:hypothetical protein
MHGLSVQMIFFIALGVGFAAWVMNKWPQPWSEKWGLLAFVLVAAVLAGMFGGGEDSCVSARFGC